MDHVARYDAAVILHQRGFNAAVDFIRGYVRGCIEKATNIANEIAEKGE